MSLVIVTLIIGRKTDLKPLPRRSARERWLAFKDAFWGLLMPVIILGGIYGGVFTPTEAAAVSAVYGLIVGVCIYRSVTPREILKILFDSTSTTAVVMFITATASLFAYILTRARIDLLISNGLIEISGGSSVIFFIIINIVLLIAGCVLDSTSALYILTPLFASAASALGIDPIHLGVVMVVNLAIGLVTPPVGVNLYVACGIGNVNIKEISKACIPLIIGMIIALLLITYIPGISLALV
jgi:C4-dicarboxylate transporter DctM subunit